jgi:WD40 repeat protein/serine/threonine protein kinase
MTEAAGVEEIFFTALQIADGARRRAYLDEACHAAPEVRARIERLLEAAGQLGDFLERPAAGLPETDERYTASEGEAQESLVGKTIGPYKVLEPIGEGGMGVVYMAEQLVPVRRRVALKVIRPGMDSAQVVARFEAERQALALMDHPNIARVLDAGSELGRPYFVMELVRGAPITRYCDEQQLTVRERLELMIPVCRAVQHAHQKGIIHRDLKPTNVLVTLHDGRPVPKVIDFGVAKALHQPLTEKTLFTNFAAMIGTPLYMSPEQAELSGLDIDTRADIYSLGVLLYELLTGTTPFDRERLRSEALDEVRRIIREEEPELPSTRLSHLGPLQPGVAATRREGWQRLRQMVRGDLDWIVMKSLEKDRTRRYHSADGLARDVERYLCDEPVEARSPSVLYRMRKFGRRHRSAMISAALILLALSAGLVASTWQAVRATRAEREAESAQAEALRQAGREQVAARLANEQRAEAERQRGEAIREKTRAEELVYGFQVRQAHSFWQKGDASNTWSLLNECAMEYRGWEHDFVHSELMRDHRVIEINAGEVRFAPDGKRFWVASREKVVAIDADGGAILSEIAPTHGDVFYLDVSRDGRHIAGGSETGWLTVWEAESGREVWSVEAHAHPITCVRISPDGRTIATSPYVPDSESDDDPLQRAPRMWDAATGQQVLILEGHSRRVDTLEFSPDGSKVATGDWDNTARLWDATTGQLIHSWPNHESFVGSVCFHPKGTRLAVASEGGVLVYDVQTGEKLKRGVVEGSGFPCVQYVPDGSEIIANAGCDVAVLDAETLETTSLLRGQYDLVWNFDVRADGRQLVSAGSGDETVMVWDLTKRQRPYALPEYPESVGQDVLFSRDGTWLVTRMDQKVAVWNIDTRNCRYRLAKECDAVTLSSDGRFMATGHRNGEVTIWDFASGQELQHWSTGEEWGARELQFSPDADRLMIQGRHHQVWDRAAGSLLHTLSTGEPQHDGRFAVTQTQVLFGSYGGIEIWDWSNGSRDVRMPIEESSGYEVVVSPDGKWAAMSLTLGDIALFDLQKRERVRMLRGHVDTAHALAFHPSGKRLASGAGDSVSIWDLETGQQVLELEVSGVAALAFSPDGRRLASMGAEMGVSLWDASQTMGPPQPEDE